MAKTPINQWIIHIGCWKHGVKVLLICLFITDFSWLKHKGSKTNEYLFSWPQTWCRHWMSWLKTESSVTSTEITDISLQTQRKATLTHGKQLTSGQSGLGVKNPLLCHLVGWGSTWLRCVRYVSTYMYININYSFMYITTSLILLTVSIWYAFRVRNVSQVLGASGLWESIF